MQSNDFMEQKPLQNIDISSSYNSQIIENNIYKYWESLGYFNPDNLPSRHKKPFTIIMPPPNANGSLHIGHALFVTLEDIMIRYQRMKGRKSLWLPGADHAGFETQVVYNKKLEKEGRSFWNIPREELYEEIKKFTLSNKAYMENQLKKLGASCDWSREKFTLDEDIIKIVYSTFEKLYKDGLVYRAEKPISWCAKHQTTLSDLEIKHEERQDKLYFVKYQIAPTQGRSDNNEHIVVATTRPETIPADVAIATHPKSNWKKFIGQIAINPLNGKDLAIISDESVDLNFGTGALKITPHHDPLDFEIYQKHKNKITAAPISIIDQFGKMNEGAGKETAGLKVKEAREKSIELLKDKFSKEPEDYKHQVAVCYKCGTIIEPRIMLQWFIKMTDLPAEAKSVNKKSLRDLVIEAVKKKEVTFIPKRMEKIFMHWMKDLRDWNISRQIVWGIRIPAWFCAACGEPKINPEIKIRWFIVRHGETDWNKEKRLLGRTDIPLNDIGRAQAQKAAEALKGKKIDLIISSPLNRTYETAKIISQATGAEIVLEDELKELHHGEAEGMILEEAEKKYGDLYTYENDIPDSEKYKDVEERAWKALMRHKKNHSHKNVVIVSHGAVIRTLRKRIKNWSAEEAMRKPSIKNCEILELGLLTRCLKCGSDLFEQETDVFDTWFSSGQWPFATLMTTGHQKGRLISNFNPPADGQNSKLKSDFEKFYPTDVMETGWDILFFWVARMVMLGKYMTGKTPFKTVYLHGLVRDKDRQKMSKSKGNVINPLEVAEMYGTDAVRMALIIGTTAGNDPVISEDKIRGYRNFATKIWNVSRFVLMNYKDTKVRPRFNAQDKKNLKDLKNISKKITKYLDNFDFNHAAETMYHYFWHTFADEIIEQSKARLNSEKENDRVAAQETLIEILGTSMKLLHPFMPFITEEIWQKLPIKSKLPLIIEGWPQLK